MKLNTKTEGDRGYIVLYKSIKYEVYAKTTYAAQQVVAKHFKVKPNKHHQIDVYLAENADGSVYFQPTT